jgi:HEAT repeat protein
VTTIIAAALLLAAQDSKHSEEECKSALAAFHAAWKGDSETGKIAAIHEVSKHHCEKTLALLAPLLVMDAEKVRVTAAKALGKFDNGKAVAALAEAAGPNDKDTAVLDAIAQALKDLDWEAGAEQLNPYLKDHEKQVVDALHVIVPVLGALGSPSSVEPLIELLRYSENEKSGRVAVKGIKTGGKNSNAGKITALKGPVEKALQEITGHSPEPTARAWEDWWKANSAALIAGAKIVYRCKATGKRWEEKAGEPVKCPYHDAPTKDAEPVKTKLH